MRVLKTWPVLLTVIGILLLIGSQFLKSQPNPRSTGFTRPAEPPATEAPQCTSVSVTGQVFDHLLCPTKNEPAAHNPCKGVDANQGLTHECFLYRLAQAGPRGVLLIDATGSMDDEGDMNKLLMPILRQAGKQKGRVVLFWDDEYRMTHEYNGMTVPPYERNGQYENLTFVLREAMMIGHTDFIILIGDEGSNDGLPTAEDFTVPVFTVPLEQGVAQDHYAVIANRSGGAMLAFSEAAKLQNASVPEPPADPDIRLELAPCRAVSVFGPCCVFQPFRFACISGMRGNDKACIIP